MSAARELPVAPIASEAAAAGVFTEDGAGMGINYLIPIDEALRLLVESRRPASERR